MNEKVIILRKLGNHQYLKYTNPKIIERTDKHIIFIDAKTGNEITLPEGDYQYEVERRFP